jgi:catabolite regulation protein CreA
VEQQKPGKKIKKTLVEALKDPKVQELVCCPRLP